MPTRAIWSKSRMLTEELTVIRTASTASQSPYLSWFWSRKTLNQWSMRLRYLVSRLKSSTISSVSSRTVLSRWWGTVQRLCLNAAPTACNPSRMLVRRLQSKVLPKTSTLWQTSWRGELVWGSRPMESKDQPLLRWCDLELLKFDIINFKISQSRLLSWICRESTSSSPFPLQS